MPVFSHSRHHGSSLGLFPAPDSLQRRRILARARQILCALASGLAVFAVCQSLAAGARNEIAIVIAAKDVARGQTLHSNDLAMVSIPDSAMRQHFLRKLDDAEGLQAQIALTAGQPLISGSIAQTPRIASGYTSIHIQLASMPTQLAVGDSVKLVSSGSCATSEKTLVDDNATKGKESESNLVLDPVCVLAHKATVLNITENASDSLLNSLTTNTEQSIVVTFCVLPEEAIAILSQQEHAPILAVSG